MWCHRKSTGYRAQIFKSQLSVGHGTTGMSLNFLYFEPLLSLLQNEAMPRHPCRLLPELYDDNTYKSTLQGLGLAQSEALQTLTQKGTHVASSSKLYNYFHPQQEMAIGTKDNQDQSKTSPQNNIMQRFMKYNLACPNYNDINFYITQFTSRFFSLLR